MHALAAEHASPPGMMILANSQIGFVGTLGVRNKDATCWQPRTIFEDAPTFCSTPRMVGCTDILQAGMSRFMVDRGVHHISQNGHVHLPALRSMLGWRAGLWSRLASVQRR